MRNRQTFSVVGIALVCIVFLVYLGSVSPDDRIMTLCGVVAGIAITGPMLSGISAMPTSKLQFSNVYRVVILAVVSAILLFRSQIQITSVQSAALAVGLRVLGDIMAGFVATSVALYLYQTRKVIL